MGGYLGSVPAYSMSNIDQTPIIPDRRSSTPTGLRSDVLPRELRELRILDQASRLLLATSLDYQRTLEAIARAVISSFAQSCAINLLESDHSASPALAHALTLHRDPAQADLMTALQAQIETGEYRSAAIRNEKSIFSADIFSDTGSDTGSDTSPDISNDGKSGSALIVPITTQTRKILGTITMVRAQDEVPFRVEDLTLAEELARRAATAIENARLYERAQSSIQTRNDFVAMVSHDLKNPLSAILLSAAFILRSFKKEKELSDKDLHRQKQVEALDRSAQRMSSLIADFLDLTRIESGKLVVDKKSYRVHTIVQDAIEMMSPLALEKSITLTRSTEPVIELGEYALFDRERIYQVLSNLLGNAIKFTPPGGQIQIAVRIEGNELIFSVQDSGPGIPGHQRPHVFDRHWQGTDRYRGSAGLGLSIAKGIVEAHDGRIWVENSPAEGSTFCFSLPHPVSN
jgi:signal transduction histidine kinase